MQNNTIKSMSFETFALCIEYVLVHTSLHFNYYNFRTNIQLLYGVCECAEMCNAEKLFVSFRKKLYRYYDF